MADKEKDKDDAHPRGHTVSTAARGADRNADEPRQPEEPPPPARPVEESPRKRKARAEGEVKLDETVPGGVYVRGGYLTNCDGLYVTKDGQPTDKPVLAEGFEEVDEE